MGPPQEFGICDKHKKYLSGIRSKNRRLMISGQVQLGWKEDEHGFPLISPLSLLALDHPFRGSVGTV